MSASATLSESAITATLQALWHGGETSPQELQRRTGLPAPAVELALAALAERGCLLERSPGHIELLRTGLGCWKDLIEAETAGAGRSVGRRAMIFQRTASTNDVCWRCADRPDADGLVVLADEQSRGRGRRGHAWSAKAGQSVLLSVLRTSWRAAHLESLTLLLGLACAEALEELLGRETQLKWPNDVLVEGRKLAGILVEARPAARGEGTPRDVVLGIGVNVLQGAADFPPELGGRATSLYLAGGRQLDRLRVVLALLQQLERRCTDGRLPAESWLPAWKNRCAMLGETVAIEHQNQVFTGRVVDIDPLQGLILRDAWGVTHALPAQSSSVVQGRALGR